MEIKLNKVTIEQFKGVKSFVLDIAGKNATITAENGIGKTTIKDAFLWCLFGKDSAGNTDFGLRPLDKDNNPIRGLDVSVELELSIDGKVRIFTRLHKENTVKKQVRGFKTECSIDEVEMPISRYNDQIAEIIPEETFKLLTDLDYFSDDKKFHWNKRRAVLLETAGEISTPEGFAELLAALDDRSMEDYTKVLKDRVKKYQKKHDEIVPRIDENQRKLKDYAENAVDTTDLEKQRKTLKANLTDLDLQRKAIIEVQGERQKNIDDLNKLKDSLAKRERELKNDTSGVQGIIDEKAKIVAGVAKKRATLVACEQVIKNKQVEIDGVTDRINTHMVKLNEARKAYLNTKNAPIVQPKAIENTCDRCNQDLPDEMKEIAEANQQEEIKELAKDRLANMEMYADAARKLSKQNDEYNAELGTLNDEWQVIQEDQEKATIEVEEAEVYKTQRLTGIDEALALNKPPVAIYDNQCIELNEEIEVATAEIGDPPADQLEGIEDKRDKCQTDAVAVNDKLRQADNAKDIQPRIDELKTQEKELAQKIADCEKELEDIKEYYKAECLLIEAAVNGKFKHVKFRLFKDLLKKNDKGEADTVPCCDALLNGVPHCDMSDGEGIFAGIDIINVLSKHFKCNVPLFIDRAETFTMPREANSQVIELHAVRGVTALEVEIL